MLIRNRWFILHIGKDMSRLLRWSFFLGIQPRFDLERDRRYLPTRPFGTTLGFGCDVPRLQTVPILPWRHPLLCDERSVAHQAHRWTGRDREVVGFSWPRYFEFTATPWPVH